MEISTEISTGLRRISNTTLISDDILNHLIFTVKSSLENHSIPHKRTEIPHKISRVDVFKESYAALLTFLVTAIRSRTQSEVLSRVLAEHRLTEDRSQKILQLLDSVTQPVLNGLSRLGSQPPRLYDITWLLSFSVKSSFSDFDGKCLYMISLKISDDSGSDEGGVPTKMKTRCLEFFCTVQQLQTLVGSLRAAVRRLEAIAAQATGH